MVVNRKGWIKKARKLSFWSEHFHELVVWLWSTHSISLFGNKKKEIRWEDFYDSTKLKKKTTHHSFVLLVACLSLQAFDSESLLQRIISQMQWYMWSKICISGQECSMTALFVLAKSLWKNNSMFSRRLKKLYHIYTMKYYEAI